MSDLLIIMSPFLLMLLFPFKVILGLLIGTVIWAIAMFPIIVVLELIVD